MRSLLQMKCFVGCFSPLLSVESALDTAWLCALNPSWVSKLLPCSTQSKTSRPSTVHAAWCKGLNQQPETTSAKARCQRCEAHGQSPCLYFLCCYTGVVLRCGTKGLKGCYKGSTAPTAEAGVCRTQAATGAARWHSWQRGGCAVAFSPQPDLHGHRYASHWCHQHKSHPLVMQ